MGGSGDKTSLWVVAFHGGAPMWSSDSVSAMAAPVSSIQGMDMCFTTVVQYMSLSVFVNYTFRKQVFMK